MFTFPVSEPSSFSGVVSFERWFIRFCRLQKNLLGNEKVTKSLHTNQEPVLGEREISGRNDAETASSLRVCALNTLADTRLASNRLNALFYSIFQQIGGCKTDCNSTRILLS